MMFGRKRRTRAQRAADSRDLGIVCAVFGFIIVFVAVMTPILHIITQNKRLEAQSRR